MDANSLTTPDRAALAEIFDLDDEDDIDLLKELYQQMREDAPDNLQELFTAMLSGDLEAVERLAHSMKSSFGNLGYVQLSGLCNEIMTHAGGGRGEDAAPRVKELESVEDQLIASLESFCDQL